MNRDTDDTLNALNAMHSSVAGRPMNNQSRQPNKSDAADSDEVRGRVGRRIIANGRQPPYANILTELYKSSLSQTMLTRWREAGHIDPSFQKSFTWSRAESNQKSCEAASATRCGKLWITLLLGSSGQMRSSWQYLVMILWHLSAIQFCGARKDFESWFTCFVKRDYLRLERKRNQRL